MMTNNDITQLLREAAEVLERRGYGILASDLEQEAASLEAQEPNVYWVLYDATADRKYIKKSAGDGSLAFFDTEAEAKRAQRRHGHGVGYKRIEYYRHPPTSAVPECTRAMEAAAERYWNERRLKAFSNDPRTWKGVYEAMLAAAPQQGGE